jgi:hypothetical protein
MNSVYTVNVRPGCLLLFFSDVKSIGASPCLRPLPDQFRFMGLFPHVLDLILKPSGRAHNQHTSILSASWVRTASKPCRARLRTNIKRGI